jgi:hypothetical protein
VLLHPVYTLLFSATGLSVADLVAVRHLVGVQFRAEDPVVISLAGVSSDAATLAVYGSYAALVDVGGHSTAFAMSTLPYLAIAFDCAGGG